MKVNVQSDIFYQIKPSNLLELKSLVEGGSKHAKCNLTSKTLRVVVGRPRPDEVWAAHYLNFSNLQVYNLLCKALRIVENTEEYTSYLLNQAFNTEKKKSYSTPPGSVRVYSEDLICFYNGKTWRKIEL